MSFFAELKRRNVFKVGVAYAIVAWLLIQIAATVLPTFDAPRWVLQTITFVIFLGFPLALFLAWAYELTPEGIKVTKSEGPAQYHTRTTGQRLNIFIMGVLVLIVGFLLVDNYLLVDRSASTAAPAPNMAPDTTVESYATIGAATSSPPLSSSPSLVRRASINLGETQPLGGSLLSAFITLSSDGRNLVYAVQTEGTRQLYHRPLSQLSAQTIPRTEGAYDAFFSPDGDWVVYQANTILYKVAVDGGTPQQLTELVDLPRGAFWSVDDIIYYASNGKLQRIAATGGTPEPVKINSEYATWTHAWPQGLPGGTHLLLTVHQSPLNARDGHIVLVSLASGETEILIRNGINARYVPTGHIVFMRTGSLWGVPFDLKQLKTSGPEVPVVNGIQTSGGLGQAVYAFSDDGWLLYLPGEDVQAGGAGALRQFIWVDRDGGETPLPVKAQGYIFPRLSPDGTQIAVGISTQDARDIWTYDLARGTLSRRTFSGRSTMPLWSPDGTRLVYSFFPDARGLAWIQADGTGQPESLLDAPRILPPGAFTPDGSQLIYTEIVTGSPNIYTLSLSGERSEQPLLATEFDERHADLSPHGRWLAYVSDETGQFEIYVRPFPNVEGGKWQVSTDGGTEPRWRSDGKELFYRKPGATFTLYAVPVETESGFQAGMPVELLHGDYYVGPNETSYDVTADGQRFLTLKSVEQTSPDIQSRLISLVVVDNWFAELKRLAPTAQ